MLSPIMQGCLLCVYFIVIAYSKEIYRLLRKTSGGSVPLKSKILLFIGDLFSAIVVLIAVIHPISKMDNISSIMSSFSLALVPVIFIVALIILIAIYLFTKRANRI